MRTTAQQHASRTNGAKSKGPVTPEGKARVSQNGTTHGIHSKRVVLAGEDPQAFHDLHQSLMLTWQPVNDFEANLITDIAEARWRLARFLSLETASLDFQVELMRASIDESLPSIQPGTRHALAFNELITRNRTFEVLGAAIRTQHRIIDRATSQLLKLRKIRPDLLNSPPDTEAESCAQPPLGATPAPEEQQTKPEPAAQLEAPDHQPPQQCENPESKPAASPQPWPVRQPDDPASPPASLPSGQIRFPKAA